MSCYGLAVTLKLPYGVVRLPYGSEHAESPMFTEVLTEFTACFGSIRKSKIKNHLFLSPSLQRWGKHPRFIPVLPKARLSGLLVPDETQTPAKGTDDW